MIDPRIMVWLIGFLLGWLFPGTLHAQPWSDASVKISNRTDSITSVGSGTIIGSNGSIGLVVTVKHLFKNGAGEILVRRRDQHAYLATLLAVDECSDLAAVMILDTGDLPQVPIARAQPRNAILAGFGMGFRVEAGEFTDAMDGDVEYTFHPAQGDSGAGLFARDGSLAGVVWGRSSDSGVAVSASRLRRFLSWPACLWAFTPPAVKYDEEVPLSAELSWHQQTEGRESWPLFSSYSP